MDDNEWSNELSTWIHRKFNENPSMRAGERLLFELCTKNLRKDDLGLLEVLLAEHHGLSTELNMFCPGHLTVTVRCPTRARVPQKLHLVK